MAAEANGTATDMVRKPSVLPAPRVLSIQSHVAFGHVGNCSAVFPLQRLGYDVIVVNTVNFSNHTGYGSWTGQVFPPEHVADVLRGVEDRGGLDGCAGVVTGYLGDAALGRIALDAVARVRQGNPGAIFCCDPVMGDVDSGLYVRPGIPEFFRDFAVPAADIITPNQFELTWLTGIVINSLPTVLAATAAARSLGPRTVLVTSLTRTDGDAGRIEMLVDSPDGAWVCSTPRLAMDPEPSGAGDCVSALFLAGVLAGKRPEDALAHCAAAIFGVFQATRDAGSRELQLILAQDELVKPTSAVDLRRVR